MIQTTKEQQDRKTNFYESFHFSEETNRSVNEESYPMVALRRGCLTVTEESGDRELQDEATSSRQQTSKTLNNDIYTGIKLNISILSYRLPL